MTEQSHEVGEIETHSGHLVSLGDEADQIGKTLHSQGVGEFHMYGLLAGPILYPVLSIVAASKAHTITNLSSVLHSTGASLKTAAATYQDTEQSNADATHSISTQAEATPSPG